MKTSSSILATMVLIAIATLGATGVHADENPLPPNHLVTSEPVADEKTWMPFRALRSMDSPKQEPQYDGKHSHHELPAPPAAKAIPAPTKAGSSNARVTPAPTKTNTPKATPASTTTKTTPHPNTTMPKVASPPATKPPATKQGKTGRSCISIFRVKFVDVDAFCVHPVLSLVKLYNVTNMVAPTPDRTIPRRC
ncbi:hypothetical protein ON010_g3678 [Phytophthora cinnamomi]|nr:hypothetical protein ON010_g3678 [Phytophthora cinnamomi]